MRRKMEQSGIIKPYCGTKIFTGLEGVERLKISNNIGLTFAKSRRINKFNTLAGGE